MVFIAQPQSTIDINNTTTALLSANGVFTGISTNVSGYNNIILSILSNVASGPTGIQIQFSDDNTTWVTYYQFTYLVPTKYYNSFNILKQFYKIIYTNGPVAQSSFSMTTFLSPINNDTNFTLTFDRSNLDALGRQKAVEPHTLLNIEFPNSGLVYNTQSVVTKTSGSYTIQSAHSTLTLSGSGIGSAISQSRKYCIYQSCNALEFQGSGVINSGNTSGCSTKIGYFDDYNGAFFSYNYGTLNGVPITGIGVNIRNSKLGITRSFPQSTWNVDKFDGTGNNGINLDFTKFHVFVIQISTIGMGIIRFGVLIFQKIYTCHMVINYNVHPFPMIINGNLPIRYEIVGAGSGDSGSLLQGSSNVVSYGGFEFIEKIFSVSTGGSNPVTVSVTSSETPILAITGNSNYIHNNIIPRIISIFDTTTSNTLIRVRYYQSQNNATTINGPSSDASTQWNDVESGSSVIKYSYGLNIVGIGSFTTDNSYVIYSEMNSGKTTIDIQDTLTTTIKQLTSNIDNVCDIICITGQTLTGTADIIASISWKES